MADEPLDSAQILTPTDLAAKLQVPASWVREKTRNRARIRDADPLPVLRVGKYRRYYWPDVAAWLLRQGNNEGHKKDLTGPQKCARRKVQHDAETQAR